MRTKTSYLLIGVFVIAGFLLITAGVVVLAAGARDRDVILAESLFEESVSGLEVGAAVRFRGVRVGRVTNVTVAGALYSQTQKPYVVVRFELFGPDGFPLERLRDALPQRIEEGLRVRLASTGITGTAYLEADILPNADKYPPKPRDWDQLFGAEARVYVPSAPSALSRVVSGVDDLLDQFTRADLPALAKELRATLVSTRTAIDGLGVEALRGEVRSTLGAVREVATTLGPHLDRVTNAIDGAAARIATAADQAGTLFADPQIPVILADVQRASVELATTLTSTRLVARDVQDLVAGRGRSIDAILDNLERATAQLRALTATAEQYPSWLLFGTPPPQKTFGR